VTQVCDGRGEPCDSLCGGAGCGKCGGLSCEDGSVTKANNAMDLAKRAEKTLAERKTESQALLSEVGVSRHMGQLSESLSSTLYKYRSCFLIISFYSFENSQSIY